MRHVPAFALGLALAAGAGAPAPAESACAWSAIDHRIGRTESGPWNPRIYRGVVRGLSVLQVGGALWEGSESRLGKTLWQGVDAELLGYASTIAMRRAFTRARPRDTDDPCSFFAHGANRSFPSIEATLAAALVTPYVLEYGSEHPATYGLLLLPLYVGVGRLKAQAHWQSDVLAGWAVGGLAGWYAHSRDVPILVEILPRGVVIGLRQRF